VKNGDPDTISISITFRTPASERRNGVYATNAWLRRQGLRPRPFGESSWRDELKFNSHRVVRRIQKIRASRRPAAG
jgi:hypothetical protein